jgi:hypothetical protein
MGICGDSVCNVAMALGKGDVYAMGVLVGNSLVVMPMVFSTRFFFPGPPEPPGDPKPGMGHV